MADSEKNTVEQQIMKERIPLQLALQSETNGPSKRESANDRHQRIYKTIRERISLLHYPPYSVIGETELAAEFNISRTPIRRVLQRLHFEGLVDIRNGVGTIVTDIDIKTMKEVYDLRMYLTELISELSPRQITTEHIDALQSLLSRTQLMYDKPSSEAYGRLCNDLHEVLNFLIGSDPLREITDNLYYRSARMWITFLPNLNWNEIISEQEIEISEMIAAMRRDDIRGVVQVRRFYLHCTLTRISDYLKGVDSPRVSPIRPISSGQDSQTN